MITARELRELLDDLTDGIAVSADIDMTPVDDAISEAEDHLAEVESAISSARHRMEEIQRSAESKVLVTLSKSPVMARLHQLLSDLEHAELHASLNAKERT